MAAPALSAPMARERRLTPVFGLVLLSLINLVNYLDRYIVAGVLSRIEDEFQLTHAAAGAVGTVFIVVYMLASPLGGYLGDRTRRNRLVAASVFLWSLATVASGLARTYPQLLWARAAIGIGEAGYGTVAPAIIADLFPRERRTRMLAFFYVAIPVGAALGYAVGGWVGQTYSWHAAFFVGGVPGILLALGMLWVPDPVRGATEAEPAAEKIPFRLGLKALSVNRVFWANTAGYTLMTFSIGGLSYWIPSFLERERAMAPAAANLQFGAVTAAAGLLGTLIGGVLGDWAERRRINGGMYVSGTGLLLAAPFMVLATVFRSPPAIFATIFAAQLLLFLNSGPINAAIVNCVGPAFRAFAMGLNVLLIHLLGDAISPPAIGAIAQKTSLAFAIQANAIPVLLGGLVLVLGVSFATAQRPPASERL